MDETTPADREVDFSFRVDVPEYPASGGGLVCAILAIALAAVCVWLTVRIINRKERWAKRTAFTILVAVLAGYPLSVLSFGWLASRGITPGRGSLAYDFLESFFAPVEWPITNGPSCIRDFFLWMFGD